MTPLANGATVIIPAGALAASTTITVQESGTAPGGSPRFTFGPAGTSFATPASVRLPVPAGATSPALYWSRPGSTTSFDVVGGQAVGGMLEAPVQHFSVGFVGAACTQGATCASGVTCRVAHMDCSSGVPACLETGNEPDGTSCGTGLACTAGLCEGAVAPSGLAYPVNPATYTVGQAIVANTPSHGGGAVTGYTVAPPLPPGLALHPATGVISGTPTSLAARTAIVVTAVNSVGSTSATLSIAVNAVPPTGLAYSTNPALYVTGVAIAPNQPSSAGGAVVTYAVAPPLPAGLSIDAVTGVITGIPTAITPAADYLVTATNSGGSAQVTLSIGVTVAPPANLVYSSNPATYSTGSPIVPNRPSSSGGAVATYSVAPPLPAGLVLDTSSGVVTGTPTAISPAAGYVVTAANPGGSARVTLAITVTAPAPLSLAYTAATATYTVGVPIPPNAPSSDGGPVDTYAVSPPLPAGLSMNATTGLITGTPSAITPRATYQVTATNTGGTASASLTVTVNAPPPAGLAYSTNPAVYRVGTPIPANAPSSGGGAVVSYAVSPPLPPGLVLGGASGIITGTPATASAAATYVVTASNSGGATTATLTITVLPLPPANLAYARNPMSLTVGIAGAPNLTSHDGGAIDVFAVVPDLPPGLTLDPVTGAIGGTPSEPAGRSAYLVTATNAGGSTSTALILTVRPATVISAGYGHTCAVVNGAAWCWGAGEYGQLGSDTVPRCVPTNYPADWPCARVPLPVTGLGSGVQAIAAGGFHTCALVNGGVWCWGLNQLGQLGNAATPLCANPASNPIACSLVPLPVPGLTSGVEAIVAGGYFTCALKNGGLWCWGDDTFGQVGSGTSSGGVSPSLVTDMVSGAEAVEAGFLHGCAIKNGGMWCWGDDTWGELGRGNVPSAVCDPGKTRCSQVPVQVAGLTAGVQAMAPGQYHTCAIVDGGARCWGDNLYGKLGDGSATTSLTPVRVSGLTSGVEAIGTGDAHTCAIVSGGLWCWGDASNYGMLGNGGYSATPLPVEVLGLTSGGQALAVGNYHTCAVVNGGIQCWGFNDFGQLGNDTTVTSPVPVPVSGLTSGVP